MKTSFSLEEVILLRDNCVLKWEAGHGLDTKLENALSRFEHWFLALPQDYQSDARVLIENLEYFSKSRANFHLTQLHETLLSCNESITDNNSIYTFIKDRDGQSNSSNDYWTEYKTINDINKHICYEDISKIEKEQWEYIKNIIYIDDFCGTGESFKKEIERNISILNNKKIFFLTIGAMQQAIINIENIKKSMNLNIETIFIVLQHKAFEGELFQDNNYSRNKTELISESLEIPKQHVLGFKNSESLFAFYNNTPNNTLGIIRFQTNDYKPLFPRKNDQKPSWQKLKKEKKQRNIDNYNLKASTI